MTWLRLKYCKYLLKRIESFEKNIIKLNTWIDKQKQHKEDHVWLLNSNLHFLSKEEYAQFTIDSGYLPPEMKVKP